MPEHDPGALIPGPVPTPVLSTTIVELLVGRVEGGACRDSLVGYERAEAGDATSAAGGLVCCEARLEEVDEVCGERTVLRGEGGTEFRSGAIVVGNGVHH